MSHQSEVSEEFENYTWGKDKKSAETEIKPMKYFNGMVVGTLEEFVLGNLSNRAVAYQLDGQLLYSSEAVRNMIVAVKKSTKLQRL